MALLRGLWPVSRGNHGESGSDKTRKLVICCSRGINSKEIAKKLEEEGLDAVSLEKGYIAWLMDAMKSSQDEDFAKNVEISLRKKFKKKIWSRFTKAINTYELVKPGDRIAVCISGGKDSMLMAKCFQELKLHNKFDFEVKFLGYGSGYKSGQPSGNRGKRQKVKYSYSYF